MKFKDIQVLEEWWQVDKAGAFHVHSSPRDALLAGGTMLSTCRVGEATVAIFLDQNLPEATKASFASNLPKEIDAVIYSAIVSSADPKVAVMDVDVGYLGHVNFTACAVAAAVAATTTGTFRIDPDLYVVRVAGCVTVEVTLRFDWDEERWTAETRELVGSSSDGG